MAVTGLATVHTTPDGAPFGMTSLSEVAGIHSPPPEPVDAMPCEALDDSFDDAGPITLEHGEAILPAAGRVALYTQWWRPCVVPFAVVVVVHGLKDHSDARGSRRLLDRAASADKQLYLYDGLAHDLLHEPERPHVMRDLASWLLERVNT